MNAEPRWKKCGRERVRQLPDSVIHGSPRRNFPTFFVSHGESGVALVITLAMLVLITIIVVGMVGALRVERGAAASHAERARAFELAKMGENEVVAKLQRYTGDKNRVWISQPGQLVAGTDSDKKTLTQTVPLSSGLAAPGDSTAPNLNAATFLDPASHLITDRPTSGTNATPPPMRLQWIYVRRDGTTERTATAPPPNPANPVVGRYAYWADDESGKVNYNTAWGRTGNTRQPGHPSKIELAALDGFDKSLADQLHEGPDNNRFFNSPLDARRLGGTLSEALTDNKFDVTHYNHDPDTTFFNGKRIVLTTKRDRAYDDTHYLRILKNENADPGAYDNIDNSKLRATLGMLISQDYLANDKLPIAPGSSFQKKYYNTNADRLTQLALNIIEYVRSRESSLPSVDPIRGSGSGSGFTMQPSVNGLGAYMGATRSPLITEVGATNSSVKVEICAPKNWGLRNEPLSNYEMYIWWKFAAVPAAEGYPRDVALNALGGRTTIGRDGVDDYVALRFTVPPMPDPVELRLALIRKNSGNPSKRLDVVPLIGDQDKPYIVVNTAASEGDIISKEVDDPRVNKHYLDWKTSLVTGGTFGAVNSISTVGKPAGTSDGPQVDTDRNGRVSDASLYMPPPASPGNDRVASIGELGYIHTGLESSSKPGTPWRTIRLQASEDGADVIPDWVFLDFFTIPVSQTSQAVLAPHGSTLGGRININAKVEPFGMERLIPLKAALLDASKNNAGQKIANDEAEEIAKNIHDLILGDNGDAYGYSGAYDATGEICEIAKVGDEGEEGETLVRELTNLLTTRGDVFTIYSIGQALKETPNGKLIVTAEQRQQTMIERYPIIEDQGGKKEVKAIGFNTVYFRNLVP